MIKIKSVEYAGGACPYQLEATTDDGKWFYLRYRGGWLRYVVAESHTSWRNNKKDKWYDYSKQIGDDLDGWADHDKMSLELEGRVEFPEGFRIESFPE